MLPLQPLSLLQCQSEMSGMIEISAKLPLPTHFSWSVSTPPHYCRDLSFQLMQIPDIVKRSCCQSLDVRIKSVTTLLTYNLQQLTTHSFRTYRYNEG